MFLYNSNCTIRLSVDRIKLPFAPWLFLSRMVCKRPLPWFCSVSVDCGHVVCVCRVAASAAGAECSPWLQFATSQCCLMIVAHSANPHLAQDLKTSAHTTLRHWLYGLASQRRSLAQFRWKIEALKKKKKKKNYFPPRSVLGWLQFSSDINLKVQKKRCYWLFSSSRCHEAVKWSGNIHFQISGEIEGNLLWRVWKIFPRVCKREEKNRWNQI